MAVAIILDFPEGSTAQYEQVVERMQLGGRMPPGGLFHAAGPHEGGLRVVDVWEDLGTFQRFAEDQIKPHSEAVGMAEPDIRAVEVAESRPASGARPEFVQVVTIPGLDADGFRAFDAEVLPDGRLPSAMTYHVNGPTEAGWCVIDAWTSKAERDRFLAERVQPAAERTGLTDPPLFEDLPVHATLEAGRSIATA
jgi:hypothetical protein